MLNYLKNLSIKRVLVILVVFTGMGLYKVYAGSKKERLGPHKNYLPYVVNPKVIDRAKSFTVLISAEGLEGIGRGTGVLIDSTHVLTCGHVARMKGNLWIYPYPLDNVYIGKPVAINSMYDLGILELNKPVLNHATAHFVPDVYNGQPIIIIGNILGSMQWFLSYGLVSGSMYPYLLTDGLILGGNSGGPWIDYQGNVVAISDWGLVNSNDVPLGVNAGISGSVILKELNNFYHPENNILNIFIGTLNGTQRK